MKRGMQVLKSVAACTLALSAGAANADLTVVRYQEYPGSIINMGTWVMREQGFCEKQGLDCQAMMLANGPLAQQAAAAGSVDLIVSSMDVMLQAADKGNDLVVVGPMMKNNIYSLSVRSDVPQPNREKGYPENMKDLVGKRVGVTARGSGTEMYVRTLLQGAGLGPTDVTYIGVGAPATAYSALMAKQVDAILSWDPVPAVCAATNTCNVAVNMSQDEGPDSVKAMNGGFVVWQARREYREKNEDVIRRFLKAQADAFEWLRDPANAPKVNELVTKNFKLGDIPKREEVTASVVKSMIDQYDTQFDPRALTGFNDFLVSNKLVSKPLQPERVLSIVNQ